MTPLGTAKELAPREVRWREKTTCAVEFQGLREGVIGRVGKRDSCTPGPAAVSHVPIIAAFGKRRQED